MIVVDVEKSVERDVIDAVNLCLRPSVMCNVDRILWRRKNTKESHLDHSEDLETLSLTAEEMSECTTPEEALTTSLCRRWSRAEPHVAQARRATFRLEKKSRQYSPGNSPRDDDEDDALLCKICLKDRMNVLFEPCMHVGSCLSCANAIIEQEIERRRCPWCCGEVQSAKKCFLM